MANCYNDCIHSFVCQYANHDEYPSVQQLKDDCRYCNIGTDVVPKSEVERLICKLECLLCHVTGGRLSKHTYDLATMETVATDCINETYNDGYGEGYKDCATEIFAEIFTKCVDYNGYIEQPKLAELKKKYQEGEPNG